MTKTKLNLKPVNGGPFNCRPAMEIELDADRVLCNDVTLPGDSNPHNVRLWVIGNEYGALGAVWADCEQHALDTLVDKDLAGAMLLDPSDMEVEELEEAPRAGNAGELLDLDHAWMQEVDLRLDGPNIGLLLAFAEARGAQYDTLAEV
jgi:hypothetical protein